MSRSQGCPRITGKVLLLYMSMITKVAGVDTPCVVRAIIVNMPRGITGASFAICCTNCVFLGGGISKCFRK